MPVLNLPFLSEDSRRVLVVHLPKGLHCSENAAYRLRYRINLLPLGKVFDIPLPFAG